MFPTRRGVFLTACGALFALLPTLASERLWVLWFSFVVALALAFGIDLLMLPRKAALAWDVDAPDPMYIGDPEPLSIVVRSSRKVHRPLEMLLDVTDHLNPPPIARSEIGRDGEDSARFSWQLEARRRGTAILERAWLRSDGPLGLLQRRIVRPLAVEVPIVPNTRRVRAAAVRFFSRTESRTGLKVERFEGDGSEFDSLRKFQPGDDTKRIDWKHSARHRRLLARHYRAERNHQVILCVDTGSLMAETVDDMSKLDHAINASLLLSYVCLKTGDRVGFFAFGAQPGPFMAPRPGVRSQAVLSRLSAKLDYSPQETNFTLGLTSLSQRLNRRSLVLVITDFVDTVTAELMLDNIGRLTRKHVVMFLALRDPRIEDATRIAPTSESALHRAVMAQRFRQEREVVIRRLTGMGVVALDLEPKQVSSQLISAYLDVKRRERV